MFAPAIAVARDSAPSTGIAWPATLRPPREKVAVPTDLPTCLAVQCSPLSTTAPAPRLTEEIVTSETDCFASEVAWLRPPEISMRPGTPRTGPVTVPRALGALVATACSCATLNAAFAGSGFAEPSVPSSGTGSRSTCVVPSLSAVIGDGSAGTFSAAAPASVPRRPKSAAVAEERAVAPSTWAATRPMLAATPGRPTYGTIRARTACA